MESTELQARLSRLRASYASSLPARLEVCRGAVARLAAAREQAQAHSARETLRRVAHQLAGTGTDYGFPQLSAWGRTVEPRCRDGASAEELDAAVRALAALIAELKALPPS
jgi:hypothetical protein